MATPALAIDGTVRLKGGGWVEGDVTEMLPGDHVTVRMSDGSVRRIPWAEVERIDGPAGGQPAAPEVAASTPEQVPGELLAPLPVEQPVPAPASSAPVVAPVVPVSPPEPAREEYGSATGAPEYATAITLALLGVVGFGGELDGSAVGTANGQTDRVSGQVDLDTSFGFGAQVEVPLHPNFAVGALSRLLWWGTDTTAEKYLFLDFAVALRVRYPFGLGGEGWGAVFLQVPIGVGGVFRPNIDDSEATMLDAYSTERSASFVLGVDGGVQLLFARHAGVLLQIGWLHHSFSEHVEGRLGLEQVEIDADDETGQVTLQGGVVFGF